MNDSNALPDTLPVLYRDDALIAVHKPADLLVHRTMLDRHETRFAVQMLRDQIGRHVYPAHRLDKGTSGVLLFALTADVARDLARAFETQQIGKRYEAIVRGHPPATLTIDHPLKRQRDAYEQSAGEHSRDSAPEAALPAVTQLNTLATFDLPMAVDRYPTSRYAHVELLPLTGRRHQLRRHLKHAAHPIIGDATYGKGRHNRMFSERFDSQRLLLACTDLHLAHPLTGETLALHAPVAEEFARVVRALAMGNGAS